MFGTSSYVKCIPETSIKNMGCCEWIITIISFIFVCLTFPISLLFCVKIVQEYERAVVFRLGQLLHEEAKGPGIFFVIPCIDEYITVDLRVSLNISLNIELLTRDCVTITTDAITFFHVCNASKTICGAEDVRHATKRIAKIALRNELGTKTLEEIVENTHNITKDIAKAINEVSVPWGIQVDHVQIRDLRLPIEMIESMAKEALSSQESKAQAVTAHGEFEALKILQKAAENISRCKIASQLTYLQSIEALSSDESNIVVMPMAQNLLQSFSR